MKSKEEIFTEHNKRMGLTARQTAYICMEEYAAQSNELKLAEIEKRVEEYGRMNSLATFKDEATRKMCESAYKDGLMSAMQTGSYNPVYCFGYPKVDWERQADDRKKIFGHNDAYTIDQYVNGLHALVLQSKWVSVQTPPTEYVNVLLGDAITEKYYERFAYWNGEKWFWCNPNRLVEETFTHYLLPTPPTEK